MKKITFIIPLNEYNKTVKDYLSVALNSINTLEGDKTEYVISIIGPSSVISEVKANVTNIDKAIECTYIENDENTGFFEQVNKAAFACVTPYFSVLEFDDSYNPFAVNEFLKYKEVNCASVYMPINEVKSADNSIYGFLNEIAWAHSFSTTEIGYIDMECLMSFMEFNVTGAFIKTEDFISCGMLKSSLGIASWYEFLMRMCNNEKKIFVYPKAGYNHTVMREGSYSMNISKTMKPEKAMKYFQAAKEEYKYNTERTLNIEDGE